MNGPSYLSDRDLAFIEEVRGRGHPEYTARRHKTAKDEGFAPAAQSPGLGRGRGRAAGPFDPGAVETVCAWLDLPAVPKRDHKRDLVDFFRQGRAVALPKVARAMAYLFKDLDRVDPEAVERCVRGIMEEIADLQEQWQRPGRTGAQLQFILNDFRRDFRRFTANPKEGLLSALSKKDDDLPRRLHEAHSFLRIVATAIDASIAAREPLGVVAERLLPSGVRSFSQFVEYPVAVALLTPTVLLFARAQGCDYLLEALERSRAASQT